MVLEGGYAVEALAGSIVAVLPVLAGDDAGPGSGAAVGPLAVDPLAVDAAERLAPWWPGVSAE